VKPSMIDTDTLSYFLRRHHEIVEKFQKYLKEYNKINLSIINYYEVLGGLKHKNAHRQLENFQVFMKDSTVLLPLTDHSCQIASEIYAMLRKQGKPVDNMDILIASIAIENELVLVTHNRKHFGRIKNLEIEDWSI
jgi:tRNA(fMet)-specific endonuclease VapC